MLTYQVAILVFGRLSNIWYILFIAYFQPKFDRTYIPLCSNYNRVKFETCGRYIDGAKWEIRNPLFQVDKNLLQHPLKLILSQLESKRGHNCTKFSWMRISALATIGLARVYIYSKIHFAYEHACSGHVPLHGRSRPKYTINWLETVL